MKTLEAARELVTYFDVCRQSGHTTAVMDGAVATDAFVVVHDIAMSNHILKEWGMLWKTVGVDTLTIGEIANGSLRGHRRPLVVDNAALRKLLSELVDEVERLETKNARLEQKINRALADLS
jgi:hypothetical protein